MRPNLMDSNKCHCAVQLYITGTRKASLLDLVCRLVGNMSLQDMILDHLLLSVSNVDACRSDSTLHRCIDRRHWPWPRNHRRWRTTCMGSGRASRRAAVTSLLALALHIPWRLLLRLGLSSRVGLSVRLLGCGRCLWRCRHGRERRHLLDK